MTCYTPGLTDAQKEAILSTNAMKMLRLRYKSPSGRHRGSPRWRMVTLIIVRKGWRPLRRQRDTVVAEAARPNEQALSFFDEVRSS